jgi:ABC-type phosphate transport system substrate-binding protein
MKLILLFLLTISSLISGAEYSVVISKKAPISTLTIGQVRDIYLQKRHTVGDQKIIPINLVGQEPSRIAFENAVLGMSRDRLNAYWIKQHFQGNSPPITLPSNESIKAFVQNVEGAIGYIPSSMVDSSIKVIYEY